MVHGASERGALHAGPTLWLKALRQPHASLNSAAQNHLEKRAVHAASQLQSNLPYHLAARFQLIWCLFALYARNKGREPIWQALAVAHLLASTLCDRSLSKLHGRVEKLPFSS